MSEMPVEVPAEDVAEAYSERAATVTEAAFEADPADARDQAEEVPVDDEEWQ